MSFKNPNRTWAELKRNDDLPPEIKNIQEYTAQWRKNMGPVNDFLKTQKTPYLNSAQVIQVHKIAFRNISISAGKFTAKQNLFGGRVGAPPATIKKEMALLDMQMKSLWNNAKNQADKVKAIAFQHARLAAIHGFTDGTGRVGRIAMDFALYKTIGHPPTMSVDRQEYIEAVGMAIEHNNIGRLANVLAKRFELEFENSDIHISPYRIAPDQSLKLTSLKDSQILPTDSITTNAISNTYLQPSDADKMVTMVGGKKGDGFGSAHNRFVKRITNPLTVGESIDVIRKLKISEDAVVSPFLKSLKTEGFKNFASERFSFVTQFAQPSQKATFMKLIADQLDGKSTSSVEKIDNFVAGLKAEIPGKKILRNLKRLRARSPNFAHKQFPEAVSLNMMGGNATGRSSIVGSKNGSNAQTQGKAKPMNRGAGR